MNEALEFAKAIPSVVRDAYSDGVSNTLKEVSKIGVDAVKTIRLALFPIQFSAAVQDRLCRYIDTAIRQVPESQRIAPRESLVVPITEQLRHHEEDNPLAKLYVNLLSRGMDRERIGEAHPAFTNIITQLTPDEASIIEELGAFDYRIYFRFDKRKTVVQRAASHLFVDSLPIADSAKKILFERLVAPECLAQGDLYSTFLEHLVSLGLVEYDNEAVSVNELGYMKLAIENTEVFAIKLTEFGLLFKRACIEAST